MFFIQRQFGREGGTFAVRVLILVGNGALLPTDQVLNRGLAPTQAPSVGATTTTI